jgi:alkanesulfonate monooxygenase SsuD/methylene tetrahydromethanopterin reductase-like flavin-dependent oxidoreductase (luciferase family)
MTYLESHSQAFHDEIPTCGPESGRSLARSDPHVLGHNLQLVKVRFAVSVGTGSPDPELLAAVVTGAEERGFDSIWFSDLTVLPGTNPFLAVAFASAASRQLRLGVNLVPFGYQPFVFARQVAELDQLSNGRLLLTLVPGLDRVDERMALGISGQHRGRLLDALLPDLRSWWAGETVKILDGEDVELRLAVLPRQNPLEIWLGGSGPEAVRRAGRLADGWLGSNVTPQAAGIIRVQIQEEASQANRTIDPEHFGLSIAYARQDSDLERASQLRVSTTGRVNVPVGVRPLRALIGELIDQGLSKFVLRSAAPVLWWPDELNWLADAVFDLQT